MSDVMPAIGPKELAAADSALAETQPGETPICEICGEEGGYGEEHGDNQLGLLDASINDHTTAHRKCWTRDPEAHSWDPYEAQPEEDA